MAEDEGGQESIECFEFGWVGDYQVRLDSSVWVYGLLKWRNEFESGGVELSVAEK